LKLPKGQPESVNNGQRNGQKKKEKKEKNINKTKDRVTQTHNKMRMYKVDWTGVFLSQRYVINENIYKQ
jgi:hypothetical protein